MAERKADLELVDWDGNTRENTPISTPLATPAYQPPSRTLSLLPLPALNLALDCFADQVGPLFLSLKNAVDPLQRPLWEPGRYLRGTACALARPRHCRRDRIP